MAFTPSSVAGSLRRNFTVDSSDVPGDETVPIPLVLLAALVDELAPVGQGEHPDCPEPIAHYTMDNISGSTLTDEMGNYDATISNMTQSTGDGGQFDECLEGGDCTSTIRTFDLGSDVEVKAVSIWVRRNSLTKYSSIFTDSSGTYAIWIDQNSGGNDLYIYDGSSANSSGLTIADTTNFYHVMIVEGSDSDHHYVVVDNEWSSELSSNMDGVLRFFGVTATSASYDCCDYDNVQLFDEILTAAQVTALYNAELPLYKKLSVEQDGTQLPVEVSPGEWEPTVEPIAHFTMDNITGSTLNNEIDGGVTGTITNMAQSTADGGKFDECLEGGLITSTIRNVDFTSIPFKAISIWFKRSTITAGEFICGSTTSGYHCYIYTNDSLYLVGSQTNHTVNDTDWHHLVIVEGSSATQHWAYLDGVKSSVEYTASFGNFLRYLGYNSNGSGQYVMNMDNLQVFDEVLTDKQVLDLYNATSQDTYPGGKAVIYAEPDFTSADGAELVVSVDSSQDDNDEYVGLTGDEAVQIFPDYTGFNATTPDQSLSRRQVFESAGLVAHNGKIQLVFSHEGTDWTTGELWVYKHDTGANAVSGTGVRVTSDGSNTIAVTSDGQKSDPIDFDVDGTSGILVTFDQVSQKTTYNSTPGKPSNLTPYYKSSVTEADQETVTGYTVSNTIVGIRGIVGELPAHSVWDSNFKAVYHMAQDPSAGDMLDSTGNGNDLTVTSAPVRVDALIGKGVQFDGVDDTLSVADNATLDLLYATIEVFVNTDQASKNMGLVSKDELDNGWGGNAYGLNLATDTGGASILVGSSPTYTGPTSGIVDDTWYHMVGTSDGTNLKHFTDGANDGSTAYATTIPTNSRPLIIGIYFDTAYYFGGIMSEVRLSDIARSADWVAIANLALTDELGTWSDYVGDTVEIVQFWDQMYEDPANTEHTVWWDQSYALFNYIVQYFDQIYGIQLQKHWDLDYSNSPLVKAFWDLLYGNQKFITKFWDLEYEDRIQVIRYWDQKYNIRRAIQHHWDQKYGIMGKEITQYFDQEYDVKNTNPLMKWFDQYYHIVSDSVVEAAALGFYIDGVKYEGPYHVSWELNVDSYKNTGEMHFNYPAPFFAAGEGVEMRIVDTDIDLYLEVTIPTKSESVNETLYYIKGESKSRILERAGVFTETFNNTTAATICTTIAARYGITIDWQIPDWAITEFDVNDQTPLAAIKELTETAAKAILQTDFNGDTVSVMKRKESDSHMWDTDTPTYYVNDSLHLEQTSQRGEYKDGYNAYRVTDQSSSSETETWLEDDNYADFKREVKVFRVPWDGESRTLYTSDDNATIQYMGIVTEELTEDFSIVNGEGESETGNPFYSLVSYVPNDTDLGEPTITEEGIIQTPTSGTTMYTITYMTKYFKWIVTDYDDETIQIWVE